MHRCSVWLPGLFPRLCPGLCPDLCLACLACLACLERSRRINASASCPTLRFACTSPKPLQMCFQIASFDAFQSRSGSSSFRTQTNPETEPRDTIPKLWQICFQIASFGDRSVDIWMKSFPRPQTHSHNHSRFCLRWLHSDTFLPGSGSSHFRTQIHIPKAIADLLPDRFIWMLFSLDLDQAIFESADASP